MDKPSAVAFLLEAAKYFEKRDTKGEDKAHWSNVFNAQNCREIANMLRGFPWQISSGTCRCGHEWEDHHGNVIMNEDTMNKLPRDHPPILPGECEYQEECSCNAYVDEDWADG